MVEVTEQEIQNRKDMKKQLNYVQLPQNHIKFPVSKAKASKQPEFQAGEVNYYALSCFLQLIKDFSNQDDMTLELPAVEYTAEDVSQ